MAEYDFEKLSREIIVSRLGPVENTPAASAEIARKIIVAAVLSTKERQDPRLTVAAVCRGIIDGLLLLNKDLAQPAVALLKLMHEIANEVPLDPADLMTWAMEGIAAAAATSGAQAQQAIQASIDETFMGAGEVFSRLCERRKP